MAHTEPMQDWVTGLIREIRVQDAPKDFNGDLLTIGDHVLFARTRGQLGEGTVIDVTQHAGAVMIQSMRYAERSITIDAEGCIKVAV